jgi:2,4-dienoyl-CoA reductase-like NADH-dependent reductase (Old Yellow Enzyme family)
MKNNSNGLYSNIILPNGEIIKNRIAKTAIAENMASEKQLPNSQIALVDKTFAKGGAGLIITGNVMIDYRSMGSSGDVVLDENSDLEPFKNWAKGVKEFGSHIWMQINHPGRQTMADMKQPGWAPSEVELKMGSITKLFSKPKIMDEDKIEEIIGKFAKTALLAEKSGFTGVEIHAAHGYLISQFLSPLTNLREDKWGGSLENRSRFLIEVVKAIRAVVKKEFCVAVKLNSADFQRGGFDKDDAIEVVKMLNNYAIDLVEVSGGTYEAPAMQGQSKDDRTLSREAYFLEFAQEIAQVAKMPVMTTGGIRRKEIAQKVLNQGVSIIGMATALAMNPELPNLWKNGKKIDGITPYIGFKNKTLASLALMTLIQRQLRIIGEGEQPKQKLNAFVSLILGQIRSTLFTRRYLKWVNKL